jgi:hypothetical protein
MRTKIADAHAGRRRMHRARCVGASALHTAVDDGYERVAEALFDYRRGELRSLAETLEDPADWCRTEAQSR